MSMLNLKKEELKKKRVSYIKALPPVPKEFNLDDEEDYEKMEINSPPPNREPPTPPMKLSLKPSWPPTITENYTTLNSGRRKPPNLPYEVAKELEEENKKKIHYIDLKLEAQEEEEKKKTEIQNLNS